MFDACTPCKRPSRRRLALETIRPRLAGAEIINRQAKALDQRRSRRPVVSHREVEATSSGRRLALPRRGPRRDKPGSQVVEAGRPALKILEKPSVII
jgi:hypothetical protein